MPRRYDSLELSGQGRLDEDGYFYDTPVLTLAEKVFIYREPGGKVRREYRPALEVFRADSLQSFKGRPITAKHPAGMVSAGNVRGVAIGAILSEGRQDGDKLRADIVIHEPRAMGADRELSLGYDLDLAPTPGVTPGGERYDAMQTNIRVNHLAVVPRGRAGREARLNLDGDEDPGEKPANKEEEKNMQQVIIRGVSYDAAPEVANELAELKETASRLNKDKEALTAERDALKDAAAKDKAAAEKTRKDAEDNFKAAVKERLVLEKTAESLKVKNADSLSDKDLKKAVIKAVRGDGADLEEKSDAYLDAAFDLARQDAEIKAVASQRTTVRAGREDAAQHLTASEKARRDMIDSYKKTDAKDKRE
jgi:hypothetical protein